MTPLAIAAGLLLLVGALALSHSRFTADLAVIEQAWADVDADLHRRHDLAPQFVEMIRGAEPRLGPELDEVVVARSHAIQLARREPTRVARREEAENDLTIAVRTIVNSLPDASAISATDQSPLTVAIDAVETLHARIAADCHLYNLAVQGHNRRVSAAPTRVIAALFGIERREYLTMIDPAGVPLSPP